MYATSCMSYGTMVIVETAWLLLMVWARFLSLAQSKLRRWSANYRPGYWSNLPCDWPSIVWAYSEQETETGHGAYMAPYRTICSNDDDVYWSAQECSNAMTQWSLHPANDIWTERRYLSCMFIGLRRCWNQREALIHDDHGQETGRENCVI